MIRASGICGNFVNVCWHHCCSVKYQKLSRREQDTKALQKRNKFTNHGISDQRGVEYHCKCACSSSSRRRTGNLLACCVRSVAVPLFAGAARGVSSGAVDCRFGRAGEKQHGRNAASPARWSCHVQCRIASQRGDQVRECFEESNALAWQVSSVSAGALIH